MADPAPNPNTKLTDKIKAKIVKFTEKHGWNPGAAAHSVNVCYRTLALHVARDSEFAQALEAAKGVYLKVLEDAAHRRAVKGWKEPRFDREGRVIGHITKYSDTLLTHIMKVNGGEKHRPESVVKVRNQIEGTVVHEHRVEVDLTALPSGQAELVRQLLAAEGSSDAGGLPRISAEPLDASTDAEDAGSLEGHEDAQGEVI